MMEKRLEIIEQPFTTPKGKVLEGVEKVVACPMWLCKSNVKKTCGKCPNKVKINNKEGFVICKYEKNY